MPTITSSLAKAVSLMVLPSKNYALAQLTATISEANPALNMVGAALDWNDGTPPIQFSPVQKPLLVVESRQLALGTYYVTLTAWNYQEPTPGLAVAYSTITVQPEQLVPTVDRYLFGPILPLGTSPNNLEWNFSTGINTDVLKSSVLMLLITSRGERLMNPTYGTNLRRVIFEPNDDVIASTVQREIDEAVSQFEPRVALDSLEVLRESARVILVKARFLSRLDQATFNLELPFAQS